ncbi:FIG01219949: hypothetical protein [Dickeya aquatica]|uniref:Uncharacterized protein n=2 Tax=Pectobacteriaceae TaxID=1903410 RepID=A0A375AA75_9GAMM|nr:FIG01219949: hypothetical protein [Dickeya aquatica]
MLPDYQAFFHFVDSIGFIFITGDTMNTNDFPTAATPETLAYEVSCMKALMTLMLKSIGQADAGKIIVNMEKHVAQLDDPTQAEIFSTTIKQIKTVYRR